MSISIEEWQADQQLAVEHDADYLPLPTAESLFAARALLALLEGTDHIEPDLEETICDDCRKYAAVAWQYGRTVVCRTCRRHRIRAAQQLHLDQPAAEAAFAAAMYELADRRADAIRAHQHDSTRDLPAAGLPAAQPERTGHPR